MSGQLVEQGFFRRPADELDEIEEEREKYKGIVEILPPILKCYCSEKSFDVCTQALQVFGGYGFTTEYPMEQYLRDSKITSIYEGTSGIQSMDLLGRKLGMKKGKYFIDLLGEMKKTCDQAREFECTKDLADKLDRAISQAGEVAFHLGTMAMSPKVMTAFAFSHPFLTTLEDSFPSNPTKLSQTPCGNFLKTAHILLVVPD